MIKPLLTTILCGALFFCDAQSGKLDPSFGNKGIVNTDLDSFYNYNSAAKQVLIEPDGSMYVVLDFSIISKRLSNGAIDSGYGFNGYSRSLYLDETFAALQPDGKIVIVGSKSYGPSFIERLDTHGLPDSSFGKYGMQGTALHVRSVAVQADGKIVVAGYSTDSDNNTYFATARHEANGSVDNTFNAGQPVITDFKYKLPNDEFGADSIEIHDATATSVVIQADGKIVLGGYASTGADHDFAIARITSTGRADSSFDGDGRQTTSFGSSTEDLGYSLAILPGGKLILAGYTSPDGGDYYFALARYNANGSRDNSFNGNGRQKANIISDGQIGNSVAIQSDGKIVMAGYTFSDSGNDFAVARFNTDGSSDHSFDGDGILTTDLGASDDYAGSVAIQPDDRIVVAGYGYFDNGTSFVLTRYQKDGTLDSSFDGDGKLRGEFRQGYTQFNSTAIQADGKIVTAGLTWNGNDYDFVVARYNSNGSADKSFSGKGKQSTDFGAADEATSLVIQSDGKIVVAGNSSNRFAIARYNTDGSPDNTFNGNGRLITSIGFADACESVALQTDGKIVVVGYTFTDTNYDSAFFAIARFNSNGTPDNTFDGDGKQLTDFGSRSNFATSVGIQKNGKIVVAGRSYINDQNYFSVARYNTDGSLDNTFSGDGKQDNIFGEDSYYVESLAIQADGKIVLGGYTERLDGGSTSFAVARYQASGEIDNSFGENGFQATSLGSGFNFGKSIAINYDGRIALGGTNDNYAIVMYKPDGSRDSSFGESGIQITNVGDLGNSIQSIAFWNNKLYAAGYGQYPGNFGVVARYLLGTEGGPLANTFITTANGNWNEPGTWVGGIVPYSTSQVIVRHKVSMTASTSCYSLRVELPAGNLIINSGVNLVITH